MEYLSRQLTLLADHPDFNFHSGCRDLKINHLAFADDLMLFCRGDITSVTLMMACLDKFGDCSGLRANLAKSDLFCAGVDESVLEDLLDITGLKKGVLPIRYLGVPLCAVRLNVTHYDPLFCALRQHFCSWQGSSLSYAGRLHLINSVIQGVHCFWMGVFPLLGSVRLKLEQLCRRFLWGGDCDKFRQSLVSWKSVCLPKKEGGLGILQLDAWNQGLLCKVLWNIHLKKDCLWIRWMNEVYLGGQDFWTYTVKKRDSVLLKCVADIRDKLILAAGSPPLAKQLLTSWTSGANLCSSKAYDFFRYKQAKVWWSKVVWHPRATPKHCFLLWLAMHRAILTADRVFLEDKTCCLCDLAPESFDHLFFQCPYAAMVWGLTWRWLGVHKPMETPKAAVKWIKTHVKGTSPSKIAKVAAVSVALYWIWFARNKKRFEGTLMKMEDAVVCIKQHIYYVLQSAYPSYFFTP